MSRTTPLLALLSLVLSAPGLLASPVERLASAVRIKTISYQDRSQIDYGEFQRFNAFLAASFPQVFEQLQVEMVNEHSMLLTWAGADASLRPVLFTAHTDVVPVEPGTEADWTHPAFDGVVADGRVYGRGTLDDKVGVLSLLEAVEQLLSDGFQPERTIVLAFGHDEEIAGRDGAAALAQRMRDLGLNFEWMVDEGGMLLPDNPMLPGRSMAIVNIAEKGYLTLTLVAEGEGGHSSNPPAISTIGRLASALAKIEANPFEPRLVAPVVAMLETIAPHVGQPERIIFDNLWLTGGLVADRMADDRLTQPFVRTTTALTMFNAGVKENVVPQRAEAKVNFRLLPGDEPERIVAYVEELIADPLVRIEYDSWANMPPVSDAQGSGFQVIAQAVNAVYPDAVVVPSLLTATTDTRHYIDLADNQYRFHGMMVAAEQVPSIHGTDEYIDAAGYEGAIEIALQMLKLAAAGSDSR